jgi:phosphate transport system ATP-binding protein
VHATTVTVTDRRIVAKDDDISWSWLIADLEAVIHSPDSSWTLLVVPEIPDFGVTVPAERVDDFRRVLAEFPEVQVRGQHRPWGAPTPSGAPITTELPRITGSPDRATEREGRGARRLTRARDRQQHQTAADLMSTSSSLTGIDAREISAWFGSHQVLDRVSLEMPAGEVTALIGPSGCGKSTFLRILNRMHEMIPSASLAGEVLIDGHDVYDPNRKLTDARREIGMVFQKPNPFPAMSIYDNVLASLRLTGVKASVDVKDEIVESCLTKAGLWTEVRDRLRQPGGGLSGGQQQRLCIARALAIRPRVLLMDEPCSALDPTSTRRIEETVMELVSEVTIVIVTHNMQQANRVSNRCAFFLAEQGTPGVIVEHGSTSAMFGEPQDPRTLDYVNGRFG